MPHGKDWHPPCFDKTVKVEDMLPQSAWDPRTRGVGPCGKAHCKPTTPRASSLYDEAWGGNAAAKWVNCKKCGLQLGYWPRAPHTGKFRHYPTVSNVEKVMAEILEKDLTDTITGVEVIKMIKLVEAQEALDLATERAAKKAAGGHPKMPPPPPSYQVEKDQAVFFREAHRQGISVQQEISHYAMDRDQDRTPPSGYNKEMYNDILARERASSHRMALGRRMNETLAEKVMSKAAPPPKAAASAGPNPWPEPSGPTAAARTPSQRRRKDPDTAASTPVPQSEEDDMALIKTTAELESEVQDLKRSLAKARKDMKEARSAP
jgi:hypothetical protein